MNTNDIKNMNLLDRLQTMEALWDSFLNEEADIDSPQWHQGILEERRRNIQNGKAEFVSLKDLKANHSS